MSRIGKKPIPIPANVKVGVAGHNVTVESGKNKLTLSTRELVTVKVDDKTKEIVVTRLNDTKEAKALHGTTRAHLANMIEGVTKGFIKELEINGVGWTAAVQGTKIVLNVGYADPKIVNFPAGVKVEVQQNKIKVSGADCQAVGRWLRKSVANVRPNPTTVRASSM